ncbi:MAG: fibrobacter succinogenes major paralogous domain-containing protein [Prolixibacteraceae bacterium]|nr:fibrobacter succinogenes major paralogous domain-containing protein [Prolixibacteraceae bacterium]
MESINTIKKVSLAALVTFVLSLSSVFAQNDTMYIMKSGVVIGQYNVDTEIDSIIFYKPTIEETTSGTFTDARDGNVYNWVQIGDQAWMAENLAYLPSVNQVADGSESAAGSYYYVYGYDGTNATDAKATSNYDTYGVLYNLTAAMANSASSSTNPNSVQGVCPTGWHLPSDAEWKELEMSLGMSQAEADDVGWRGTNEGSKLAGNAGLWNNGALENDGDFGTSNFTALPGGWRHYNGTFVGFGSYGYWWSSTDISATTAWYRNISYNFSDVFRTNNDEGLGFSVRCVRD